jgi:hypothetical protein
MRQQFIRFGGSIALLLASAWASDTSDDKVDFKYMYYWDKNKVWNHTPTLSFLKNVSRLWSFKWDQEFDIVSGASRRLGLRNVGQEGDHDLVLDGITGASKQEIRHSEQASLGYSNQGRVASASFYFSDEKDYTSYSPTISGSWDFNERNTTLGGTLAIFWDNLHPPGAFKGLGGDRKITSSTVSLTQTLSPTTMVAVTANSIQSNGVLGHPYNPVILATGSMLLEHLPGSKTSFALGGQVIQGFAFGDNRSALHFDLRYYRDSWKLSSLTAELQLYQYLTEFTYFRIRARGYKQNPAAFAKDAYVGNEVYRSADIRYYGFSSLSLGAKIVSVFPDSWERFGFLPDRWDIGYDHGFRNTRGEDGGIGPFTHYQLFPRDEYYQQGVFMVGLGFDL